MWKVKNTSAATKRSKTASDKKEPIEYCYQEWVAPTQWIVKSSEGSIPYKNSKKKK